MSEQALTIMRLLVLGSYRDRLKLAIAIYWA